MLDRYLLRYFLAVIDQGNFSRAAQACNVAQPTLSVGIAKLERMIGQAIFVRSNQRVELTEAGTRFLAHARRIEREFNTALQAMGLSTDLPPFRLGVLTSIPGSIVAASVADTQPGSENRFELLFGSERELIGHLAKGRIDVALTLVDRGAGRFAERPIIAEGYVLALSDSHPLAKRNEIAPEELAEETMIVRRHCEALSETSRFFTERGVRPHFALRSTNDERVLQMVAAGLGVTVVPECYAQDGISCPRLTGFNTQRTIGWIAGHGSEHFLAKPRALMNAIEKRWSR
ncbi:MAG: LysR family transcriptional regulator [Sphingomonas sp.]|nr:LysR family transcriptional regulator [Sphingomonas sp.]MDX3884363.1 LysR family transcriptional regulator [Sphingomonas sp.]